MNIGMGLKPYMIVVTVVLSLLIAVTAIGGVPRNAQATTAAPGNMERASAQQSTYSFVVDHYFTDASGILQSWLDQGRALDTFFAHMSVGDNIMDGMDELESQNPTRYTIEVGSGGASWFASNDGILERPLGDNFYPLLKVDTFDDFIGNYGYHVADLAMMKFCPGDLRPDYSSATGQQIWNAYRPMMEDLIEDYPDVTFVWWTFPLASVDRGGGLGNDEREVFNTAVRDYVAANGGVLFDIADIQSHDPSGNPVVDANGYEAMWDGYTSDGGHLNEVGGERVANAVWWLLAKATPRELPYKSYLPIVLK